MGVIEATRNQAFSCPEVPSSSRIAAITAVPTHDATAGEQVLRRHLHADVRIGVDADPVRDGFHSPKGPAGATGALVSDLFDGGTLWPLFPCIEAFRQLQVLGKHNSLGRLGPTQEGTTQPLQVAHVHVVEVVPGLPRGVPFVDIVDQLI